MPQTSRGSIAARLGLIAMPLLFEPASRAQQDSAATSKEKLDALAAKQSTEGESNSRRKRITRILPTAPSTEEPAGKFKLLTAK